MQSSITTFFQRSGTSNASSSLTSAEKAAETEDRRRKSSPIGKSHLTFGADIGTPSKPVSSPKKRRLVPEPEIGPSSFQQVPAVCSASSNGSKLFTEYEISNYLSKYEQSLRRVVHRRSVDELKKMFMETLVLSPRPNQLWTKQFANRRCLNQDIDDLICSWMRTFLRRRPIDIDDDEVALLETYRVRSAIEQQRDREFIVDDSDDDEIPLCRVLVLEGPIGSGKTSAVHSCLYGLNADKSGVIEVNVSQRRRQSDIVNRFKEATQSQWIADAKKPGKPKTERRPKGGKGKRKKSHSQAVVPERHAVILIDDVDVAVEDDPGFLKGVAFILKDTKRPIVLTCAEIPRSIQPMLLNGYYNFLLSDQNQNSMLSFLLSIALSQGALALPSHADLGKSIDFLQRDLRSALNNLQFWLDTDREKLIEDVKANRELSCLSAPRISLYPLLAGFSGFRLDALWMDRPNHERHHMVWYGLDSGICNVIHENYLNLSCVIADDPRDIQSIIDLAKTAEGLSLADLFSTYQNPCDDLILHSRMIALASGTLCEYYEDFVCGSYRSTESPEPVLSTGRERSMLNLFTSIWYQHYDSVPQPKHLPSSFSFVVDHMSAIRSISSKKTRNRLQRRTRRYQNYLKSTLKAKGLESLEHYCNTVKMEPSVEP